MESRSTRRTRSRSSSAARAGFFDGAQRTRRELGILGGTGRAGLQHRRGEGMTDRIVQFASQTGVLEEKVRAFLQGPHPIRGRGAEQPACQNGDQGPEPDNRRENHHDGKWDQQRVPPLRLLDPHEASPLGAPPTAAPTRSAHTMIIGTHTAHSTALSASLTSSQSTVRHRSDQLADDAAPIDGSSARAPSPGVRKRRAWIPSASRIAGHQPHRHDEQGEHVRPVVVDEDPHRSERQRQTQV